MTPANIALVQQSFGKVAPIADQAADMFYDCLFRTAPELRDMFPADMTEQKAKLMTMLGVAVANLHQVERIADAVQELGRRHVGYGVQEHHYDLVGAALLDTLARGLGDDFTADTRAAWAESYAVLAGVMKTAGREAEAAA